MKTNTIGLAAAMLCCSVSLAATGNELLFEENLGQADRQVRYIARGKGQNAYFFDREIRLKARGSEQRNFFVRLSFPGSRGDARWEPGHQQVGTIGYFLGNDPAKWVRGAPQYSSIMWRGAYRGVDVVFHGRERLLEYDLVLAAGADPSAIRIRLDGPAKLHVNDQGEIEMPAPGGPLRQRVPKIYQERGGRRDLVPGRFVKSGRNELRLELGPYDKSIPLVVDPVLEYSSYLGGENDDQVVVAGDGFTAGNTSSVALFGAAPARRRSRDVFVKFGLQSFSSFTAVIGGSGDDEVSAAIVSSDRRSFYVVGSTNSRDFPQGNYPAEFTQFRGGASDGFLIQVMLDRFLSFNATLLGGSGEDRIRAVAANGSTLYMTGATDSPDLPVTRPLQSSLAGGKDAFIWSRVPIIAQDSFVTYLGGSGDDVANAIAIDSRGRIYIGGETRSRDFPLAGPQPGGRLGESDAFLTRIDPGSPFNPQIADSRLIGGSGTDRIQALAIRPGFFTLDPISISAAGTTTSPDFPLVNPIQKQFGGDSDAFVLRLTPDGPLAFSTYIGGSGADEGWALAANT